MVCVDTNLMPYLFRLFLEVWVMGSHHCSISDRMVTGEIRDVRTMNSDVLRGRRNLIGTLLEVLQSMSLSVFYGEEFQQDVPGNRAKMREEPR